MRLARRLLTAFRARLAPLVSDTKGNIALAFCLIGPAVLLLGAGAIDLLAVHTARERLQSIADAGALAGGSALTVATNGAAAKKRAAAFVDASMSQWTGAPFYEGDYKIVDQGGQRAIHVQLKANRPSFFANLLPPGGWDFVGQATATSRGLEPLCILKTARDESRDLKVKDTDGVASPVCMVHSNEETSSRAGR